MAKFFIALLVKFVGTFFVLFCLVCHKNMLQIFNSIFFFKLTFSQARF
jgi:hypothetical protein